MEFIAHTAEESWGQSTIVMEVNGHGAGRAYMFSDDPTTVYLDLLSVSVGYRREGLGTALQKYREDLGRFCKATYSCLWVIKGTWQEDWYKRRGYVYYRPREEDPNTVWMQKKL